MVGMVGMAEVEERDLSMSIFSLQLWINFWVRFENRGEDATAEEKLLMAVLVATGEMAVTQVKVVMVDLEDPFVFLFPKPTLTYLESRVPRPQ